MINELKKCLADTYALYLKTQNYHWNVEGIHFHALHVLFEEQYTELAEAIDVIAERIRALGSKAPGSFSDFDKIKTIPDAKKNIGANEMLSDLVDSHKAFLKVCKKAFSVAEKAEDEVTMDLLIERMSVHEKTIWMLDSHLKK